MRYVSFHVLAGLLVATQAGCSTGLAFEGELTCLTGNDCPPQCECPNPGSSCVLLNAFSCGGSCDRQTSCPDGASCSFERMSENGVWLYACLPGGTGGTGGTGGAGGTGGTGDECDSVMPGDGNPPSLCRDDNDCTSGSSCDRATCLCSFM